MTTNNQPQRINAVINQNPEETVIKNPALQDYIQRQKPVQKTIPTLRLWVAFKQPSAHKTWSWDGSYLVKVFKVKYPNRSFNLRQAVEFKLEQIMDNVRRAVIYDNRPESKYPIWKEYLNGKLVVDNSNKK